MAETRHSLVLRGRDETSSAISSAERNFAALGRTVKGLGVTLAATFGVAGLGRMVQNVADTADRVGKLQQTIGGTTEFLSQFNFVLERSNVNLQTGATALQRLQRNSENAAAKGVGPAAEALAQLGINAERFADLELQDKVLTLAEAFDRVESSAEQVSIAQKLVDSEGVALIRTFEGGAEALQGLLDRADELNRTISQDLARNAAVFNDHMTDLRARLEGATLQLGQFLPILIDMAEWLEQRAIPGILGFARSIGILDDSLEALTLPELNKEIEELTEKLERTATRLFSRNYGTLFAPADRESVREIADELLRLEQRRDEILSRRAARGQGLVPEGVLGESVDMQTEKEIQKETEAEEKKLQRRESAFNREQEQLIAHLQARGEAIEEQFLTEQEREQERYEDDLFITEERFQEGLIRSQEYFETLQNLKMRHEDNISKIEKKEVERRQKEEEKNRKKGITDMLRGFATITQGVARHNRALFEINRIGAISTAILNVKKGITESLAAYPMPYAQIMAALHAAVGAATIAEVVGTSYGGGGGAPSLATAGTPVTPVSDTGQTIDFETPAAAPEPEEFVPEISLTVVSDDAETTRRMIDRINEQYEAGYRLRIS